MKIKSIIIGVLIGVVAIAVVSLIQGKTSDEVIQIDKVEIIENKQAEQEPNQIQEDSQTSKEEEKVNYTNHIQDETLQIKIMEEERGTIKVEGIEVFEGSIFEDPLFKDLKDRAEKDHVIEVQK